MRSRWWSCAPPSMWGQRAELRQGETRSQAGRGMMRTVRRVPIGLGLVAATLAVLSVAPTSLAQQIEPRPTRISPPDSISSRPSTITARATSSSTRSGPIEDAKSQMHIDGARVRAVLGLLGQSASVGVVVPYAWLSGRATFRGEEREREVSASGTLGSASPSTSTARPRYPWRSSPTTAKTSSWGAPCGERAPRPVRRRQVPERRADRLVPSPEIGISRHGGR